MSETNVIKIIQELIPEVLQHFNLDEDQVTQFITEHLKNSDYFQNLLSKDSNTNE